MRGSRPEVNGCLLVPFLQPPDVLMMDYHQFMVERIWNSSKRTPTSAPVIITGSLGDDGSSIHLTDPPTLVR